MLKNDLDYILKHWNKTVPAIVGNTFRNWVDKTSLEAYYPNYHNAYIDRFNEIKPRKSDTVFILGSGASINDISASDWEVIAKHDTMTFNWFAYQDFVDIDYYLIKDITYDDRDKNIFLEEYYKFNRLLVNHWAHYQNTLFILQSGPLATNVNKMLYHRILPKDSHITGFKMYRGVNLELNLPWLSMKTGTLLTCVNLAIKMGWSKIVLTGIDLYNRDYFWFKPDQVRENDLKRGAIKTDPHNTTEGIIKIFRSQVLPYAEKNNILVSVLNRRSLLTDIMPVHEI